LSKEEAFRRLKILIPDFILKGEIFRIWKKFLLMQMLVQLKMK
jgi:hypothetical protein